MAVKHDNLHQITVDAHQHGLMSLTDTRYRIELISPGAAVPVAPPTGYRSALQLNLQLSNIRHEDFRPSVRSFVLPCVTLRGPPLDSETGWTGELWSNPVLLILEN